MRLKKWLCGATAAALCMTTQSYVYVVEAKTIDSASALITDAVTTAMAGITATSMNDALSAMQSKITVASNVVSYADNVIGYWYAEEPDKLYATDARDKLVIQPNADGYTVSPTLLDTLLTDINAQIKEQYTPTTGDWSRIVGNYDITLGDVTIPASQWIDMEPSANPIGEYKTYNLTQGANIDYYEIGDKDSNRQIYAMAYMVDASGDLYLSNMMVSLYGGGTNATNYTASISTISDGGKLLSSQYITQVLDSGSTSGTCNVKPDATYIQRLGLTIDASNASYLIPTYYITNTTASKKYRVCTNNASVTEKARVGTLYNVNDGTRKNTSDISTAKRVGMVWFKPSNINNGAVSGHAVHTSLFTQQSCSKLVVGNSQLTKRLLKLKAISNLDSINVQSTGWYLSDGTNIDAYLGAQQMANAGDTADIDAVAEVEPLSFNVIVPTTLPLYIAADGTVSTADNATVVNKSNAAVKMTDIAITGKPESGWTLVTDRKPSDVRDAKEFTFTTSLVTDTVMTRGETLPFTYAAELSPMTDGTESLDLATVSVTVDWAD